MSTPDDYIRLAKADAIPDRPFTNLDHNVEDLIYLQYMAKKLRHLLSRLDRIPALPRPYVLYLEEREGRRHRVALTHPEELLSCNELAMVGFCGNKRPGADRLPLDEVDRELLAEFMQHPHLLSYSSLQVDGDNYRNLVLFNHPVGIGRWAISPKHAYAAQAMSPGYYRHIRIHSGVLPGGLRSSSELVLVRTKYYDYSGQALWWAVRELQT